MSATKNNMITQAYLKKMNKQQQDFRQLQNQKKDQKALIRNQQNSLEKITEENSSQNKSSKNTILQNQIYRQGIQKDEDYEIKMSYEQSKQDFVLFEMVQEEEDNNDIMQMQSKQSNKYLNANLFSSKQSHVEENKICDFNVQDIIRQKIQQQYKINQDNSLNNIFDGSGEPQETDSNNLFIVFDDFNQDSDSKVQNYDDGLINVYQVKQCNDKSIDVDEQNNINELNLSKEEDKNPYQLQENLYLSKSVIISKKQSIDFKSSIYQNQVKNSTKQMSCFQQNNQNVPLSKMKQNLQSKLQNFKKINDLQTKLNFEILKKYQQNKILPQNSENNKTKLQQKLDLKKKLLFIKKNNIEKQLNEQKLFTQQSKNKKIEQLNKFFDLNKLKSPQNPQIIKQKSRKQSSLDNSNKVEEKKKIEIKYISKQSGKMKTTLVDKIINQFDFYKSQNKNPQLNTQIKKQNKQQVFKQPSKLLEQLQKQKKNTNKTIVNYQSQNSNERSHIIYKPNLEKKYKSESKRKQKSLVTDISLMENQHFKESYKNEYKSLKTNVNDNLSLVNLKKYTSCSKTGAQNKTNIFNTPIKNSKAKNLAQTANKTKKNIDDQINRPQSVQKKKNIFKQMEKDVQLQKEKFNRVFNNQALEDKLQKMNKGQKKNIVEILLYNKKH